MKINKIGKICGGQDGAIWNNLMFRFDSVGNCRVYQIKGEEASWVNIFTLPLTEKIKPHSNAVMFGTEYFEQGDEFPLLYSNIYNNHAKDADPLKGVCCVYRIQRNGNEFTATLVQLIRIGFTQNEKLWCSAQGDIRPYGNFAIDRDSGRYYAFTMRDGVKETRYFAFNLPKLCEGEVDAKYGVRVVTLSQEDIKECFDCEYHRFIQGACIHKGKLYSLEGFSDTKNPPAMRIIDLKNGRQEKYVSFMEYGLTIEPEFIDFIDDTCYYSNCNGELYIIEF